MSVQSLARKVLYQYVIAKISDESKFQMNHEFRPPLKVSFLGNCQFDVLVKAFLGSGHRIRHVWVASEIHSLIPDPLADDDLAVINLSLRHILSDGTGLPIPASDMIFAKMRSAQDAELLIEKCKQIILGLLKRISEKYSSTPTLFTTFFEPSFSYLGDLQDPYSPTSPRQFVRKLNETLSDCLKQWSNFHLLDVNDLLNQVGRKLLQDDIVHHGSHASFINDWDFKLDAKRLSAPQKLYSVAAHEQAMRKFANLFMNKIENIHKIITQNNQVKMIICDLDDTLWRGVAAESDEFSDSERIEGWPLGLIEALLFFKARGGILALCSKNDAAKTPIRFERIFQGALTLDDFAVIRVNWEPKSKNVSEILKEANLLARNCLFIDDNVREVSEVMAQHPEIRCLGTDHYNWRGIVLQASETQVPVITAESERRTELVRAAAKRSAEITNLPEAGESREEWLKSLGLRQAIHVVRSSSSKYYNRAFELTNKTNQFNTTGKRWTASEFQKFLESGGVCLISSLRDKKINNGIICVCLVDRDQIVQMVLSCRVFGLGAEVVMGAKAVALILKNHKKAYGQIVDTGRNGTCLNYFGSIGFRQAGDRFQIDRPIPIPSHIQISDTSDGGFAGEVAAAC
jgi:FkbH-like protein